ncbi:MAG TPA: hypothetical protein VKX17_07430 [Planctomycetota bacterium]|nr:hypothetical protein [Planctomycetota bacterium]
MTLSSRDRWLLALLPAVLTASIYIYGPGATQRARMVKAQGELQAAQEKPFDRGALSAVRSDMQQNRAAFDNAKKRLAALSAAPAQRLGPESEDRSATLRALTAILEARGLVLVKSEKLPIDAESALGRKTLDAWKAYAEKTHAPAPQIWRVELRGSYPHMQQACEELARAPQFIVPLSVTMEMPVQEGTTPAETFVNVPRSTHSAAAFAHRDPTTFAPASSNTTSTNAKIGGLIWTLTLWL